MLKEIRTAVLGIIVLTIVFGLLYPLLVTGIAQVAFPGNANGQKVFLDGKLVGSKLIGQNFGDLVYQDGKVEMQKGEPVTNPDPRYFQTRPSATTPADNAAATTFSNLGPNNVATVQELKANISAYIQLNGRYVPGGLTAATVPVDAADSSASGIDPDISVANADIQAHRIAAVRGLTLARVDQMVSAYTGGRGLGFSGEPGVNVLELNLALDRATKGR